MKDKGKTTKKLKTMNDISAAEAVGLFHAAMSFYDGSPTDDFTPRREDFPKDIAARDFLECLDLYRRWWMDHEMDDGGQFISEEEMAELVKIAPSIPDKDLERLSQAEKQLLHVMTENPGLTVEEYADKLNKGVGTIKAQISQVLRKLGVANRNELFAKATGLLETSPRAKDLLPKNSREASPVSRDEA